MIRLDRYLCEMEEGTRSEVKELLRKGRVSVDGCPEKNPARKVDEKNAQVCVDGRMMSKRVMGKNIHLCNTFCSAFLQCNQHVVWHKVDAAGKLKDKHPFPIPGVFPARAGVIPTAISISISFSSIPRASGGDPHPVQNNNFHFLYSPRERG